MRIVVRIAAIILALVSHGEMGVAQTFKPTPQEAPQPTPQPAQPAPQPAAQNTYGAIALSKRGTQHGIGSGYASLNEAEKQALRACGKRAKDCELFKSIENDCIALVIAKNGAAGWAAGGPSESDRRSRAMGECKKNRGDVLQPDRSFLQQGFELGRRMGTRLRACPTESDANSTL
jgi:hypothetical protein